MFNKLMKVCVSPVNVEEKIAFSELKAGKSLTSSLHFSVHVIFLLKTLRKDSLAEIKLLMFQAAFLVS